MWLYNLLNSNPNLHYVGKVSVEDTPSYKWENITLQISSPTLNLQFKNKTSIEVAYEVYKALSLKETEQQENNTVSQRINMLKEELANLEAKQNIKK